LTKEIGAENFEMRYMEIPVNGRSSHDKHPYEHEVFIIRGNGIVKGEDDQENLSPGDALFIPGNEVHQLINTGNTILGFICIIPTGKEDKLKHLVEKFLT
jgi:quercetin dioxygenase-like cupin family protein